MSSVSLEYKLFATLLSCLSVRHNYFDW